MRKEEVYIAPHVREELKSLTLLECIKEVFTACQ